jgi:hypothetical protein
LELSYIVERIGLKILGKCKFFAIEALVSRIVFRDVPVRIIELLVYTRGIPNDFEGKNKRNDV